MLNVYNELGSEERERLIELATLEEGPAELLALMPDDVVTVAEWATGMKQAQAHAIAEARRHGATLATYEPASAQGLLPARQLLDMAKPDDF